MVFCLCLIFITVISCVALCRNSATVLQSIRRSDRLHGDERSDDQEIEASLSSFSFVLCAFAKQVEDCGLWEFFLNPVYLVSCIILIGVCPSVQTSSDISSSCINK